jgi:hypothetical protein
MKTTTKKAAVAALGAITVMGGFLAAASEASAQPRRGGWSRGYNGYGGAYRGNRWGAGNSLALGLGIGAAVAGGYGLGYGRGYYGAPGVYGPGYYGRGYGYPAYGGYYGAPGYAYGYGRTCLRRVWDPYIGRNVRVRVPC